ncbi:MAG: NADH-quinone oxidoreductase subunit NuoH [Armatimonadota bacterium]|jgi:NADH-quinone oxidoreductase subunit H
MTWPRLLEVVIILLVLLSIPIGLIWFERRLLAGFQDRYGPNRVGAFGLLQPVADAIKLFMKEDWVPPFADRYVFVLAPSIVVVTVLLVFGTIPFTARIAIADFNVGLLFFLAMASLGVYSIVLSGWASNSKYSLIGGLRAAAQMISYEIPMALSVVGVAMLAGSLRLGDIVEAQRPLWFCVVQPIGLAIFLTATIAEARRIPFDLPEADSEIVSGYHTEYSSMKFGLFFLGEYLDIVLVACMTTVLFLGGWQGPWLPSLVWFAIKVGAVVVFLVWVRSALPRFRFDQLMDFGWKVLLPLSLLNILVTGYFALSVH